MAEVFLHALLRQALLLSFAVVLLGVLRPLLRRHLGAGAVYAAWLLVPAVLLTTTLPRPSEEPLHVVLKAVGGAGEAALPALPAPAASQPAIWLALWLAGTALVLAIQTGRQWRIAQFGDRLPAGSSPALVGLLRPHVVLPLDFEARFTPAERTLVLAHEQVHRERLDNLWNLLACALAALHWWNPLAWWALHRLRADQELACDAIVLAARPDALATYTRALLAAHDLTHHGAPLASRWGTAHPLVERIAMLKAPRPLTRRRALLLAAAVAGVSTLAYAAESSPADGKGYVDLQVMVERSQGSAKTGIQARLVGQDGKPLKIRLDAITSDTPGWATEALWIELLPQKQGDAVLIKTRISLGDPGVELGHPSVISAWGTKARIEIARPGSDEKLAVELTPTELPADYRPPKNSF